MGFRGKKIVVFGLARSGVGAANLLSDLGAEVTVTDGRGADQLAGYVDRLSPAIRLFLGGHPEDLNGADLIVVSPGVPLSIEPLRKAKEKGIEIIGELELAYQVIHSGFRGRYSRIPEFLAITGTNGKSTTTTLLGLMLQKTGFGTILGGNIGNALTEEILGNCGLRIADCGSGEERGGSESETRSSEPATRNVDFIVVEVSSFQLEAIERFKPRGAAILNITPDHLDRYHSLSDYIDAKCRIFENQGSDDFLVLNADDPMTGEIAKRIGKQGAKGKEMPGIYYFSRKHQVKGAYLAKGKVYFDLPGVSPSFALHPASFKIRGVHNLENAMAASAMALLAGCPPEAAAGVLSEFGGLEHRMEFVRELDGVSYINDSKGTNVGAVAKSLDGFRSPIILIAGGRDKAGDFGQLRPLVRERVKALVLIGEASEKMKASLGDLTETVLAPDLEGAVSAARRAAGKGDVVLLSPACASFDMFRDFEDRGAQFKKIVLELS